MSTDNTKKPFKVAICNRTECNANKKGECKYWHKGDDIMTLSLCKYNFNCKNAACVRMHEKQFTEANLSSQFYNETVAQQRAVHTGRTKETDENDSVTSDTEYSVPNPIAGPGAFFVTELMAKNLQKEWSSDKVTYSQILSRKDYKTTYCENYKTGQCSDGNKCSKIHESEETEYTNILNLILQKWGKNSVSSKYFYSEHTNFICLNEQFECAYKNNYIKITNVSQIEQIRSIKIKYICTACGHKCEKLI